MEYLGCGVVAVGYPSGGAFVSWRLLGTDPDKIEFNVYRVTGNDICGPSSLAANKTVAGQ